MIAGSEYQLAKMLGQTDAESESVFYKTRASEIWPDIDPYLMTRTELDNEIKKGIKLHEKYFPTGQGGLSLLESVLVVAAVGAVAVYFAGTAAAAGGVGQAAAQGAAASTAGATANAAGAISGYAAQAGAAGAGITSSAGATSAASAAAFGSKAFAMAKSAAPYVKGVGAIAKAGGNSEADKLIKTADVIENSGSATKAGEKLFKKYLEDRGMKFEGDNEALRERLRQEQLSYAAWLRRRAAEQQKHNPDVETSGQKSILKWLPLAIGVLALTR